MKRFAVVFVTALLSIACRVQPGGLATPDAHALQTLARAPEVAGELVYRGRVHAPPQGARTNERVAFEYERRVRSVEDGLVSTHLSRRLDGTPVLSHAATHAADYRLRHFEEVHAQTGTVGTVVVSPDGRVRLQLRGPKGVVTREETVDDPVVVGPTLFGFALTRWDELVAGGTVRLRFAVPERARTYPFVLRMKHADAETVTFELVAQGRLMRRLVAPMQLVFTADTRQIVRYEGRVPPLLEDGERLRPLDARVEYTFVADLYR